MVDALREAWRVLAAGGLLVDLRPLSAPNCPLELATPGTVVRIGRVDASGMLADDRAADEAMAQVVGEGLFVPVSETRFEFEFSWDTVGEMAAHLRESRRVVEVTPSYAELEQAHRRARRRAGERVRLRYARTMRLGVYRRAARTRHQSARGRHPAGGGPGHLGLR